MNANGVDGPGEDGAAHRTAPPTALGREATKPPGRKVDRLLRRAPLLAMRLEGSAARLGSRGLRRRNGDLRALENAFQRRDAGGDIASLAVFQRHSGVQRPGITVGVVARPQAVKLLAAGQGVLARCLCGKWIGRDSGPARPIATIALASIAATWRKFDRETAAFGVGREYVVILLASLVWTLGSDLGCEPSLGREN